MGQKMASYAKPLSATIFTRNIIKLWGKYIIGPFLKDLEIEIPDESREAITSAYII
jgi:hypothetical protein